MITLCFRSVLCFRTGTDVMYFKPDFLEWCKRWDDIQITSVYQDHDPGYTVDLTYDFEITGLTPADEALWVLRWGKSSRNTSVLPKESKDYMILSPPFSDYSFTVEVPL